MGEENNDEKKVAISIEVGDIVAFEADVIALKFAQWLHGADRVVANALGKTNADMAALLPMFGHKLLDTNEKVSAARVLFVSVPRLNKFDFAEITSFTRNVLKILQDELPTCKHLAMTIHGVGIVEARLDETKAFEAQLAAINESFECQQVPGGLERISIVEKDKKRAARLGAVLKAYQLVPALEIRTTEPLEISKSATPPSEMPAPPPITKTPTPEPPKPQVFVLMPATPQADDFFEFGIRVPAAEAGYACLRAELPGKRLATGGDGEKGADEVRTRTKLFKLLRGATNLQDLPLLGEELNIPLDDLGASGLQNLQLALVKYLERRGRLYDLVEWLRKNRPLLSLDELSDVNPTEQLVFADIQKGIDDAAIIVADLTGNEPVILFLVGYALGKGKETILIVRGNIEDLAIDISEQLRLPYIRIMDLHQSLKGVLPKASPSKPVA